MEEKKAKDECPADPKTVLRLMTELYRHWGCQILVITDPYSQREEIDLGFRKRINLHYNDRRQAELLYSQIQKNTLYLYTDEFLLNYAIFPLPTSLVTSASAALNPESSPAELACAAAIPPVLCIGPILFHNMKPAEISSLMSRYKLSPQLQRDMEEHYNQIPLLDSREIFVHTLQFFIHKLSKESISFREISYGEEAWGFSAPEGADYTLPEQQSSPNLCVNCS